MRIAICDDNQNILKVFSKKIGDLCDKHKFPAEIVTYNSGSGFLFAAEDECKPIDIVYLDIKMPHVDGITIARKLKENKIDCQVIFLTDQDSKWEDAFDLEAMNYLVKSRLDDRRFEKVFLKATEVAREKKEDTVIFSRAGESRNILISHIKYFEVIKRMITVYYDDEKFEFYSPMSKIEEIFSSKGFIKTHRAYLVNKNYIKQIKNDEAVLLSGETVPLSRGSKKKVLEFMKKELD